MTRFFLHKGASYVSENAITKNTFSRNRYVNI